ncbi:MAG: hypothetical protein ABJL33_15410 [Hyphomicrobiales bacterium]
MLNTPHHPKNIAAAFELVNNPALAALAPLSVRETAWITLKNAHAEALKSSSKLQVTS